LGKAETGEQDVADDQRENQQTPFGPRAGAGKDRADQGKN